MAYSRIPGTFGNGFGESPSVDFQVPANPFAGVTPTSAGTPGRIPNTYGEGANSPDEAPAVRFEGPPPMNTDADSIPFGNGVCLDGWGYYMDRNR